MEQVALKNFGLEEKTKMEIAHANFTAWNEALKSKNPHKVALLYTVDNDFLPTMSDEFKKGLGGAEAYFKDFLEKNPVGEIVEESVKLLAPNCYLHSGMYNFEVNEGLEGRQKVEARFSFVWVQDANGEWKITHHHSSLKPQPKS